MPAVLLSSCTRQEDREDNVLPVGNAVRLTYDSVAYDHTSQFVTVTSDQDWTITLSYDGIDSDWASVSPASGSGTMNNIILTYEANDSAYVRTLTLTVAFSGSEPMTTVMRQGGNPNLPGGGTGGSTGGEDPLWPGLKSDPYQTGWLELPSVEEESGRAFVFHMTEVGGRTKRNYSMLYDAAGRIALWVAYPLCNEYMGSGRTDAWSFDPKIPDEYEPVLFRGWPEGGFDRGHQIPSGSRNSNTAMNRQTFYFTNMTAQNSRLNQEVWATLENKVRGYASVCDTLYVVTGPIFDYDDPSRWQYTEDNNGNSVAVPDGYFKVLLRYTVSSSTYYSAAFVYENRDYGRSEPSESDMRTVADVEEMTGIKFFNNLPQDVASSVKQQYEPGRWGL
ncbi:MAG TPA: DNA/RNA non-specific endonuclease [Candidatus Coprenecus pullistercoris]|nr:DNA/RNA non-specific endonuclease [Candidatus Coprenecus pullistercoris]